MTHRTTTEPGDLARHLLKLARTLIAGVAVAGALLATDMRADRDYARVWQSLGNPAAWTIEQIGA